MLAQNQGKINSGSSWHNNQNTQETIKQVRYTQLNVLSYGILTKMQRDMIQTQGQKLTELEECY